MQNRESRLVRYRGKWAVQTFDNGKRQRRSLGTDDLSEAQTRLAQFNQLTAARQASAARTLADVWAAYAQAKSKARSVKTMMYRWKALHPHFAHLTPNGITQEHVDGYIAERKEGGRKDWTIWSELGLIQNMLRWALRKGIVSQISHFERPTAPPPKNLYMTRDQFARFYAALNDPHQKLFAQIAIGTAARKEAITQLTWDRVDFEKGLIHLAVPGEERRKGRALVPMNRTLRAALSAAKQWAICDQVIEWGGKPVKDVKNGIRRAAIRCGMPWISAHVIRHTAAVWLVEGGTPMSVVAQYLGHSSTTVTERVYARYSPDYLAGPATLLEWEDDTLGSIEPKVGACK